MRQHNLKVTGSLQINGENVISASELSTLSASINSKIEGLNPSQIGTGSYTASISPNGAFSVNTNTIITGSLSVSSLSGSGINYLAYSGGVVTAISGTAAIKYNEEFVATLGQTTFTPAIGYITDLIDVFYNGTKLSAETDYTASNGSTVILTQAADKDGDIIEVAIYNPVSGVSNNTLRQQTTFTASTSQTTFSVNYTPGLIDVYFNGSHLANEEYTANNGTSIILSEAATGGEIVDVFVYSYQVGAFSGIGGQGQAGQFAYFSSQNGISGSSIIAISGSDIIAGGDIIPLQSGSYDLGSIEKPFRHIYVGTGSIYLVDNSGQVTNTISAQTIVTTDTLASGTIDLTDSLPSGTVSGSSQVIGILSSLNSFSASNGNTSLNSKTGSYATTGSNTFVGTQIISGSTYVQGDLVVLGSSSIQYISASSVSIGTNIVQLNTATPGIRFAGLAVQDSGSSAGVTGSMLWDSLCNRWIYSNPSTVGYSGGMLMSGPRASTLGSETPLTCNYIAKSGGGDHLYDSCIIDDGTTTCIKNNLVGTGTISGTTIYGSTAVCSPVGKFTSCIDVGSGTFSSGVTAASFEVGNGQYYAARRSSGNLLINLLGIESGTDNTRLVSTGDFNIVNGGLSSQFKISSTGVATFACSVGICNGGAINMTIPNGNNGGAIRMACCTGANEGDMFLTGGGGVGILIAGSGKIGIGTTTPQSTLHIGPSLNSMPAATSIAVPGDTSIRFMAGSDGNANYGSYIAGTQTAGVRALSIGYRQGAGDVLTMTITQIGDGIGGVGIGTSIPLGPLEVRASNRCISSDGILQVNTKNSQAADLGGSLSFGGMYQNSGAIPTEWAQISGRKENSNANEYGGYLSLATRPHGGVNTERVRVTSAGVVSINSSGAEANAGLDRFTMGYYLSNYGWMQTWASTPLYLNRLGNNVSAFGSAGFGLITTTSSDIRIKKNIVPIESALDKVNALRGVYFEFDKNNELKVAVPHGKTRVGLIAQEVETIIPEAVIDGDNGNTPKSVDYTGLVGVLVKAIQELEARVKELENK